MKRTTTTALLVLLIVGSAAVPNAAAHESRYVQGPHCGGDYRDSASCSFRYGGGQLYLGGSVRGTGAPEGAVMIRLEARSRVTGRRYVVLSCATPASGGCSAGGSYETVEHVRRGQRLFCIVVGHGRGEYECGTLERRR